MKGLKKKAEVKTDNEDLRKKIKVEEISFQEFLQNLWGILYIIQF